MSQTIYLKGIPCNCIIGIYDWERKTTQLLRIDIEAKMSDQKVVDQADHIRINYWTMAELIQKTAAEGNFHLIEKLADELIKVLFAHFSDCESLTIRIDKTKAIPDVDSVGVIFKRNRSF